MPTPKPPPRGYGQEAVLNRKKWLKEQGVDWEQVPQPASNYSHLIENQIGEITLPLGVAGPAVIDGQYAKGTFYIPLATLEGTLNISMTRGLYATALSGGIKTIHVKQELSRSPIFNLPGVHDIPGFIEWIKEHYSAIKQQAESTTRHGKLLRIDPYPMQNRVILDFVYYTQEASGQNMTTIATKTACVWIMQHQTQHKAIRFLTECNFNGDKNAAYRNMLLGRGHGVIATAEINKKTCKRILQLSPEEFVRNDEQRNFASQLAGINGHNMHLANALAAIYIATGQDAACVIENAMGTVTLELSSEGNLVTSITMPSLTIGTIGGGTKLPQQNKSLAMLGCQGPNSSKKLAEIISAACLGLELSLGAAIICNHFSDSHKKYGRIPTKSVLT